MTKTNFEKELEGDKWFRTVTEELHNRRSLSENDFEFIIVQAISRYFTGEIAFIMFIDVINRLWEIPETIAIPEMRKLLTKLLDLADYASDPARYEEKITDALIDVLNEITKN